LQKFSDFLEVNCLLFVSGISVTVCLCNLKDYTVSQKKQAKLFFVITMPNFHQIGQFLAQRWQIV